MASFFENLAMIMGGEDQITPEFRTAFSELNSFTAPPTAVQPTAPAIMNQQPTVQPTAPAIMNQPVDLGINAESVRGAFGLGGMMGSSGFMPPSGTVTTGQPAPSGLYGGPVTFNAGQSAYGAINPSSYLYDQRNGASNLAAAVQRAQYQDYLNRFAPIENFAVSQVQGRNTADLGYDLARANQSVMNAGQNLQGQQERAMGRFGLQYQGPSIAQSNEITGGRVAAMNEARIADEGRALNMLAGGTGGGNG